MSSRALSPGWVARVRRATRVQRRSGVASARLVLVAAALAADACAQAPPAARAPGPPAAATPPASAGRAATEVPTRLPTTAPTPIPTLAPAPLAIFPTLPPLRAGQPALEALGPQEMAVVGGCLRGAAIAGRRGPLLVWPHGFRAALDGGDVVVLDPRGRIVARVGERMDTGGGYYDRTNLPREEWRNLPKGCPGPYFQVHTIEGKWDPGEEPAGEATPAP